MERIGILVFDKVEILDFAGPFEVFSVAQNLVYQKSSVITIAKHKRPLLTVGGLSINPSHQINQINELDLLIISGGIGTRKLMEDEEILKWIKNIHATKAIISSICSGSLLLAKCGLLDNKNFCTHQSIYPLMGDLVKNGKPQNTKRFVGDGKIYTSGGISAGIDLSLHIVENFYGKEIIDRTIDYMEYQGTLTQYLK